MITPHEHDPDALVNLRELCLALSFVSVLVGDKPPKDSSAKTALLLAELMEDFCRTHASYPAEDKPDKDSSNKEKFSAHKRMADDIIMILEKRNRCTPSDLLAEGYSDEEIAQHWSIAYAIAMTKLGWTDA